MAIGSRRLPAPVARGIAAIVIVALAIAALRAPVPVVSQLGEQTHATLSASARAHLNNLSTVTGLTPASAATGMALVWLAFAVLAPTSVRRRSVWPIRRRGPPFSTSG